MNPLLFPDLVLHGGVKIYLTGVEPDHMDQFMGGDIQEQRIELDEGVGPLHGIQYSIVLKTDFIKMHAFGIGRFIVLFILVLANVGEGPVIHFVMFEIGQGFNVIPVAFYGLRTEPEMPGR
jgi:hypothetical protein